MDENEIKRTTDPRKKAGWAKSASNLQNQRRQESSGRTETEGGAREDKQVGRMRKLCQERQP